MTQCHFAEFLEEFALGSFDADERERVLEHIRLCPSCAEEAGNYLEALSVIALDAPDQTPPLSLGRFIMAEARHSIESPRRLPRQSVWRHWPVFAAAAVAAIALAWTIRLSGELENQHLALASLTRRYDIIVGVLAASEVAIQQMSATEAAPGAMGRIYLDRATGAGMLMHRLPPLTEGKCYQLWFVGNGERVNGGVLRTNPDGSGYTIIQSPGPLSRYTGVGVTQEPAGGSPWPTTDRLLGAGI
ncbi:MAG: anti-sigma factor domain-containing protein [Chloroflexota bacterium]